MGEVKKHLNHRGRTAGCRPAEGFTLIEMIVVMALLGIMLMFSLPRLHETLFLDDTKNSARWIITKVQTLREKAVENQKNYALHIDLDSGRLWETDASMSPESMEAAALDAYALPDDLKIVDVEFPIGGKLTSGQTQINFYKTGITDKALIHVQDQDAQLSFLIEPFLTTVKYVETYATFDD